MCGIIGHIARGGAPVLVEETKNALDLLHHRGPDESGFVTFSDACLGHRRLKIIDLHGGRQPFSSPDNRYTLVFNGEIYNYLELKKEIASKGYRFQSDSDTEVLLYLLMDQGTACLPKLNGMFAFAFWDNEKKILLFARDRFGKKPLYYSLIPSGIIFCSEIPPLLNFSEQINLSLDPQAISSYFAYQSIGNDLSIFQGIKKVPQGSVAKFSNGKLTISKYWNLQLVNNFTGSFEDAQEEFLHLLNDAVKLRMRSDVPIGAFLSGGVDSTAIVKQMNLSSKTVCTFTVGFDEAGFDESREASISAALLKTKHHTIRQTQNILNVIDDIVNGLGEPMSDPSVIPFWYLCKFTRKSVSVALSGDGADEMLGGYSRYLAADKILPYLKFFPARILSRVTALLPDSFDYYSTNRFKQVKLISRLNQAIHGKRPDYNPRLFLDHELQQLIDSSAYIEPQLNGSYRESSASLFSLPEKMIFSDINNYLTNDILVKIDRMSMTHSLEIRSPFLDHRLVSFTATLPLQYKIRGNEQKSLLRQSQKQLLPPDILNRKKHGFAVPIAYWLKKELYAPFRELLRSAPPYLKISEIEKLHQQHCSQQHDHSFKLWSIFLFLYWHNKNKHKIR